MLLDGRRGQDRHRAVEASTFAGGKGVNVARALKLLGRPVIATGLAGGPTGARLMEHLAEESILTDFTPVADVILLDPTRRLPRCGSTRVTRADIEDTIFYCIDNNEIWSDENLLFDVYDNSGDFGVAVLLAEEWAVAIQHQML